MDNTNPWKLYVMGNPPILIKAQKSMGGAFYNIEVEATGLTGRYLADVFEVNAYEVKSENC